jgi:hypothetical protein
MKLTLRLDQVDPDKFRGYVQTIYNMMRLSEYVTTGEYFMNLYDEDLDELLQSIEEITVPVGLENPVSVENVMMLTIMLRTAEGIPDMSEEDLHTSMGIVCTYAAMEKLARMGQVEIFHENMCVVVDEQTSKRIIVRKI